MATKKAVGVRLLSRAELIDKVSLSFPYIWSLIRQGRFPEPREVGGKPLWVESEIDDYIASLPVRKYKALA